MEKKQKFKIKFTDALLWSVLALSLVHFTFLLLGLFGVIVPACLERASFNYIVAFVLVGLCLCLYILLMFIEHKKNIVMPVWFKIVFYIAFYVFTNVYYYFGLFGSLAGLIIFYICLAFVINIIALSIFFNTQKTETNILKSTTTFTTLTTFTYAVSGCAMLETIISALKILLFKNSAFTSVSMFIIDMCIFILVSVIMAIIFSVSLSKKKTIINNCLIKYYK